MWITISPRPIWFSTSFQWQFYTSTAFWTSIKKQFSAWSYTNTAFWTSIIWPWPWIRIRQNCLMCIFIYNWIFITI
ncbi:ORF MSV074 hypothetical protein [Melanoplus sanguinipes entomopoxvirus]|uniref:Uncharacterized protein n=1 Tax=Melanoplus sanguinipes entomopoxvirus TaxID=83191 RepID=Q9YW17_MSEPV|nr:ORF MSV074 hypothetical protein [Melanoplus sanguinipes entomopoxvirus]AAC97630.1 ORF MSV074 hypothetical protein [Melanoplus sanguinipes entomopoxvirus 'O']